MVGADEIERLFTGEAGGFLFARWGRPVTPVVFGVEEEALPVLKGALEAVFALAGHPMAGTDPELGANLMVFFCRDWDELLGVPNLDRLVGGLDALVARLGAAGASQYRMFRFDEAGAIRAAFVFLRMDGALAAQPAEDLGLGQAVQVALLWSDRAFAEVSPLALTPEGRTVLRPEIAAVIRAAYDPVLPPAARDPAFALRLAARVTAG
ncbi:hypothetical protein [Wenxinia marina]|uniref:Uncharacterized protein n=1 Tax=Wenxinia marina DSM 24838 TaxID=1123501 RepID=A0A0D0PA99_9RHOB|nr:hypothetical protein [Wenxinia marina]KIQ68431.1 hypothetical protein Wenmar_03078 [Wenxinia marina DSM 24838]GGL72335.1 hypothetical protein GCM10011392_28580 [Wenxinia marina]